MIFTLCLPLLFFPFSSATVLNTKFLRVESTFTDEFCNVTCRGRVHTMCPAAYRTPKCEPFGLYPLQRPVPDKFLELLVNGHNGVRDRIARRMGIPNMLEVMWDVKLADMAENYLGQCKFNLADECTQTEVVFDERESINTFYKFEHSPSYIVQNMYQEDGTFYPFKFIERVIRFWYFEKDRMMEPTDIDPSSKMRRIYGENNFTHLAYPFVYRIGCALATYRGKYNIICYYYPFYRTHSNTMYYETGEPGTNCPARFPLRDDTYKNLCTSQTSLFKVSSSSEMESYLWSIILFLFFCTKWFSIKPTYFI